MKLFEILFGDFIVKVFVFMDFINKSLIVEVYLWIFNYTQFHFIIVDYL